MNIATFNDKVALAKALLREAAFQWDTANDHDKFKEEHIQSYGSRLSFDDLLGELDAIILK